MSENPPAAQRPPLLLIVAGAILVLVVVVGIVPTKKIPWFPLTPSCGLLAAVGLIGTFLYRRDRGERWYRSPGSWAIVALLGVFLAAHFSQPRRVTADGIKHFAYLRSVWVDHDLQTGNDFQMLNPRAQLLAASGSFRAEDFRNVHPIGPAILWSPFYLVADLLSRAWGEAPDGANRFYQNAAALGGLLWGWAGLLILERTLRRRVGPGPALVATLGIGLGCFLTWYIAYEPTMAHGPGFTMVALFLHLWLTSEREGWRRGALLGGALGLVALLRPANVLVGLVLVADIVALLGQRRWRALAAQGVGCAVTLLVVFSPQMLVWRVLHGGFLVIPQGKAFVSRAPAYDGVLFSPDRGLFSWSPILYLGAVGLILLLRSEKLRALGILLFLLALTRLNAGVADWSGGSAFGARRFDATLPFFGWGLALLADWARGWTRRHPLAPVAALVGGFIVWNAFVMRAYESGVWGYVVSFEQMGHAVISGIDGTIGPVVSLPGALAWAARTGLPHTRYGRQYVGDHFGRAQAAAGREDRFTFWLRWSVPGEYAGETCRFAQGTHGVLVFGLNGEGEHAFGARVALTDATTEPGGVTVVVNGRPVGRWDVGSEWTDLSVKIPAGGLRTGRNEVHLVPGRFRLAVANVWIAPE